MRFCIETTFVQHHNWPTTLNCTISNFQIQETRMIRILHNYAWFELVATTALSSLLCTYHDVSVPNQSIANLKSSSKRSPSGGVKIDEGVGGANLMRCTPENGLNP